MDIYAFRGKWWDQVHADNGADGLSYAAMALGYALGWYMTLPDTKAKYQRNGGKLYVWCTQEDLSERTGINRARISTCIKQLIERGHIRLVKRGNNIKRRANKYRIVLQSEERDA